MFHKPKHKYSMTNNWQQVSQNFEENFVGSSMKNTEWIKLPYKFYTDEVTIDEEKKYFLW